MWWNKKWVLACPNICERTARVKLELTDFKDKSKVKGLNNDPDACPRCCGKVYANEMMQSKGRCFHKDCFTCYDCEHILNVSTGRTILNTL